MVRHPKTPIVVIRHFISAKSEYRSKGSDNTKIKLCCQQNHSQEQYSFLMVISSKTSRIPMRILLQQRRYLHRKSSFLLPWDSCDGQRLSRHSNVVHNFFSMHISSASRGVEFKNDLYIATRHQSWRNRNRDSQRLGHFLRHLHSTNLNRRRTGIAAAAPIPAFSKDFSDETFDSSSESHDARNERKAKLNFQAWKNDQTEILQSIQDYQRLLSPLSTDTMNKLPGNLPSGPVSEQLENFVHPSVADLTWQKIVESEEAFARLCRACHESLSALGSISSQQSQEYDDENDEMNVPNIAVNLAPESDLMAVPRGPPMPKKHNKTDHEIIRQSKAILRFWERIRKERTVFVDALQPVVDPNVQQDTPSEEKSESKMSSGIGKWFQSFIGISDDDAASSKKSKSSHAPLVEAHKKQAHAPNHFHYTRVLGRMFYRFPRQRLSEHEWYQDRARNMRELVAEVPDSTILSKKSVRLLVRAHTDIQTLEGCQQAEEMYHRFPAFQQNLVSFILHGYWLLTKDAAIMAATVKNSESQELKRAQLDAATATNRVAHLFIEGSFSAKRRDQLFAFGFHCFANTSSEFINGYYGHVESLARRRFGRKTLEELQSGSPISDYTLHTKDIATIHHLIRIYGQPPGSNTPINEKSEDFHLERALHLSDRLFEEFTVTELQDNLSQPTFQLLVQNLAERRKRRRLLREERDKEFEYAMKIVQRMMLSTAWWPSADTWHFLFRLADDGLQGDQVWRKHELCTAIKTDSGLPALAVTKHTLNAWTKTSRRIKRSKQSSSLKEPITSKGPEEDEIDIIPSQRAWQLFQSLHCYSTPYFFAKDSHQVNHLYNTDCAPDQAVYTLVWHICSNVGDWETAEKVFEFSQNENGRDELGFVSSTYAAFIRCLAHCPDEERRLNLSQQMYEEASANRQVKRAVYTALKVVNPDLYAKLSSGRDNYDAEGDTDEDDE